MGMWMPRYLRTFAIFAAIGLLTGSPGRAQDDVADVPSQDIRAGGDQHKRYFLIGPRAEAKAPKDGYGLVLVMPGGDGGPDFHPFVKRVFKYGLGGDYLVAQLVAVKWTADQQIVWPTEKCRVSRQAFSTEKFLEAVIEDVKGRHKLNDSRVFTLSWSSSGPAAYAASLSNDSSVKGSFVAMSVFKPNQLPPLAQAKGHAYFIYHSPDDRTCPFRMAERARAALSDAGAAVRLATYNGGHGWQGNVYADIRRGIKWLEQPDQSATSDQGVTTRPAGSVLLSDSFETGDEWPDGWQRGARVKGVRHMWDKKTASDGSASLCLKKGVRKFFPIAEFSRTVPHTGDARQLEVSVQVKAQRATKAVVDVQFLNAGGAWLSHEWATYIGAKEDGDPPVNHDWKAYSGTVSIPAQTKSICIALQIYGPGAVWFDELTVGYAE